MCNTIPIDNRDTNQPKNGWLWVQDYPPELVKLYFLSTAVCDWLFWHCAMNKHEPGNTKNYKCDMSRAAELIDLADEILGCGYKSENRLGDLFLDQMYCFPYPLIVKGPVVSIHGDVAVASFVRWWNIYPHNQASNTSPPTWVTLVLIKESSGWLIKHTHQSLLLGN